MPKKPRKKAKPTCLVCGRETPVEDAFCNRCRGRVVDSMARSIGLEFILGRQLTFVETASLAATGSLPPGTEYPREIPTAKLR